MLLPKANIMKIFKNNFAISEIYVIVYTHFMDQRIHIHFKY